MQKQPLAPLQNVLCIEASDLILTWVVPLLEKLGCHVIEARDLQTALTIIQRKTPVDLVLLGDLGRPDHDISNGPPPAELTLLLKLRSTACYRKVPIIVFTSKNWLASAKNAGATDHLVKPAGAEELEAAVLPHLPPRKS